MSDIGVIGLGVMGKNIALNMINKGFKVSGFNRTYSVTKQIIDKKINNFEGYEKIEDFTASLNKPRKIFLMVKAGNAVDLVIDSLIKNLEPGDIIMDGGNSYFMDTNRRHDYLNELGIKYYGVGVSGGEEGALNGPSIMPSGDKDTYNEVGKILESIAAKKDDQPCCTYIGPKGSGHYVKMVHNGIEYADMQLLAETYLILKYVGNYSNKEIAEVFEDWNKGELQSYLLEITSIVLKEKDDQSDNDLIDMILDVAGNKGTGRWTSIEALNQEFNASLLTAAYQARIMSNQEKLRSVFKEKFNFNQEVIDINEVKKAYELAKSIAFSQGFGLYEDASNKYDWNLNFKEIASIFRAGCIIQSKLLQKIMDAYENSNENMLFNKYFKNQVDNNYIDLKNLLLKGIENQLPLPVYSSSLIYLNQIRSELLGANLIQGQRDYFGAHTYQRIDKEGFAHHNWSNDEK